MTNWIINWAENQSSFLHHHLSLSMFNHSFNWMLFLSLVHSSAALEEEHRNNANTNGTDKSELSTKQKHQMKHRELFLSRQVETLPATHIRGKCSVTLLNEEESLLSYLNKDVSEVQYCLTFLRPTCMKFCEHFPHWFLLNYRTHSSIVSSLIQPKRLS